MGRDKLFHRENPGENGPLTPAPLSRLAGVRRFGGQCRRGLNTGRGGEMWMGSWDPGPALCSDPGYKLSRPVGAGEEWDGTRDGTRCFIERIPADSTPRP
jgi:hypothetical protein